MKVSWLEQFKDRKFLVALILSVIIFGIGAAKLFHRIVPWYGVEILVWCIVFFTLMYYVFKHFDKWYDRYFSRKKKLDKLLDKMNPDLECERYWYRGILLQRLNNDYRWYVIYGGQIVNWSQYRHDLESWIDSVLDKK